MVRAVVISAAAALVIGIGGVYWFTRSNDDGFEPCRRGQVAGGQAAIGGPFSLVDTEGRRVTEADVITGPTLVYFGYSFCPDFCPMDLTRNAGVADRLAEEGKEIGQVFISVDPARDTPESLKEFTGYIHPDLIGLTGTEEEVAAAARAYKVYFRLGDTSDEFYLVDHSTFTYLMDPEHGFLEFYPSDMDPEAMAESVACYVERI